MGAFRWWTFGDLRKLACASRWALSTAREALRLIRADISRGAALYPVVVRGASPDLTPFPEGFTYATRPLLPAGRYADLANGDHDVHVSNLAVSRRSAGWGLETRAPLAAGARVCDYTGDLVGTPHEGPYVLTVREHAAKASFTLRTAIDARRRGGVARFANHSCDPNMEVLTKRSRINQVPALALVTKRAVSANEELTFDYSAADSMAIESLVEPSRTPCLCGAKNCRRWLPRHVTS